MEAPTLADRIAALAEAGASTKDIAHALETTAYYVYLALRRRGFVQVKRWVRR